MLTFVLMQALDLDIENGIRVDLNPGARFHKRRQTNFVLQLDGTVLLAELRVIRVFFQVDQLVQIVGPLFLQGLIQQIGQQRVALLDPATRRDAVGHVVEFGRPQLVIFREQIFNHQIRVQGRYAVHRKAAHHAHVRHANLLIVNHCQLRPDRFIAWPGFIHQGFKPIVNLVNDLHMARQQRFHQLLIPALQRFRHQGVVGVGEGAAGNRPGVIPAQLMLVDQHAQQFRNGDGRVRVVELNHFEVRQLCQLAARQMMTAQNVRHGAGALEILLHQTQFFTRQMVVVRVEDFGQLLGVDTLLLGTQEIAVVEFGQVERMSVLRLPQAQRLRHAVTVAKHRQIPGFTGDGESRFPEALLCDFPTDADLHVQLRIVAEPRVGIAVPVIWRFHLVTISERLTEQAILIVEAIANGGLANRCHGVKEAGRQATQTTVTESRVNLFFQQVSQVDVVRFQHITHLLIPAKVQQIVARQAANQEFHRDIVDVTLAFDGLRHGLSIQLLCERPAHRLPPLVRRHLVCSMKAKTLPLTRQGSLELSFVEGRL